jgi:hypothetical protein
VLIAETGKDNDDNKDEWFIDSGASASVAFNKQSFLQYDLLSTPIKIWVGNNAYVEAIGKGTVTFISCLNGINKVIRLMEVLHVPEICRNLVSVSQLTKKGPIVSFKDDVVMIHMNDSLLVKGKKSGSKLFRLNVKLPRTH